MLPKHRLEEIQGAVQEMMRKKFKKPKNPKYGNINKGFTDEELRTFLSYCLNPKANMAYRLMANLGLRVGEVVKIRLDDIDFPRRKIHVLTEKARTGDTLYLHDEIYQPLKTWVDLHLNAIQAHSGHILYSESDWNREEHISPHWLRNTFRDVCVLSGMNENYGRSEESYVKQSRKLYRLTTHSLRHYFITRVYKGTKDPIVAQKLARHTSIKSTQVYIHSSQNDLDMSMDKVFEKNLKDDMREKEDMKKLAQLWQIIR
ncbi:MAG: site-specific integrase [Nanoarchaeota archaeon]